MSSIRIQQLIRDQFGFAPTVGQQSLIEGLEEFTLKQGGHNVLLINGYAGTGKTSVLAAYLKTMKDIRQKTKIMAPTGRAAKVISVKAGQDAFTIHKLIYRRKSKADLGSPISLNVNLHKNTVFVVDEASMIGDYTMTKDGNISARNLLEVNSYTDPVKSNLDVSDSDIQSIMTKYKLTKNDVLSAYRTAAILKQFKKEVNVLAGNYLSREDARIVIDRFNKKMDKTRISVGKTSFKLADLN